MKITKKIELTKTVNVNTGCGIRQREYFKVLVISVDDDIKEIIMEAGDESISIDCNYIKEFIELMDDLKNQINNQS